MLSGSSTSLDNSFVSPRSIDRLRLLNSKLKFSLWISGPKFDPSLTETIY